MNKVIISFGGNIRGRWGAPYEAIDRALDELSDPLAGSINWLARSQFYRSAPVGAYYAADFYNLVAVGETGRSPLQLLGAFKGLERRAGRRGRLHWGARPLDIDLIDYEGVICGWGRDRLAAHGPLPISAKRGNGAGWLRLPHGLAHRRAFVLKPLQDIAPRWQHPVLGLEVRHLMANYCSPLMIKACKRVENGRNL